jgi:hypothetical protein
VPEWLQDLHMIIKEKISVTISVDRRLSSYNKTKTSTPYMEGMEE